MDPIRSTCRSTPSVILHSFLLDRERNDTVNSPRWKLSPKQWRGRKNLRPPSSTIGRSTILRSLPISTSEKVAHAHQRWTNSRLWGPLLLSFSSGHTPPTRVSRRSASSMVQGINPRQCSQVSHSPHSGELTQETIVCLFQTDSTS